MESEIFRDYTRILREANGLVGSLVAQLSYLISNDIKIATSETVSIMKDKSRLIDMAVDEYYEGRDTFKEHGIVLVESYDPTDFSTDEGSVRSNVLRMAVVARGGDIETSKVSATFHMVPLYVDGYDGAKAIETWLLFATETPLDEKARNEKHLNDLQYGVISKLTEELTIIAAHR